MGNAKSLILGAVGLAVLIALVMLFLKVNDSPAREIDQDKLKQAQARYQRTQVAEERARPTLGEVAPRLERPTEPDPEETDEGEAVAAANGVNLPNGRRDRRLAPGNLQAFKVAPAALGGSDGTGTLRERMDSANKLYDKADYEGAREAALEILEGSPGQVRMLRIVVSSSCIMGDHDVSKEYFAKLERDKDRDQMSRRCSRYGVELEP